MCSYVFSMQNYPLLVMLGRIPKIMDGKWNASTKQIAQQRSTKPHVQNTSQIVLVTCVSMRSGCLHTLCHPFQHQQIGGCGPCGDLFQRRDWSLPWKWTQLHGSGPPRLFCGGHVPPRGLFSTFFHCLLSNACKGSSIPRESGTNIRHRHQWRPASKQKSKGSTTAVEHIVEANFWASQLGHVGQNQERPSKKSPGQKTLDL